MNLLDLTRDGLVEWLAGWGYGRYHADLIWQALYEQKAQTIADIPGLRPEIRHKLEEAWTIQRPETAVSKQSQDGTRKFLLKLADGETIETVLMQFEGRQGALRTTACISAQAGCAMGCVFCATGQMGFTRHLTPGEIVGQVLFGQQILAEQGKSLRNIVFMGMGEPLHNYDAVMTAVRILTDHKGLAIAPKHITISTVGVVPGIRRLSNEKIPVRLAVSLHGATDGERQALVPPARRWPLAELMAACHEYTSAKKRRILFEWTLIEGKNDTPAQAETLADLLSGLPAHVNLIPLNPTVGYNGQPARGTAVRKFQAILREYGIPSTVRQRRGIDIAAGCGQLKSTQPAPIQQFQL